MKLKPGMELGREDYLSRKGWTPSIQFFQESNICKRRSDHIFLMLRHLAQYMKNAFSQPFSILSLTFPFFLPIVKREGEWHFTAFVAQDSAVRELLCSPRHPCVVRDQTGRLRESLTWKYVELNFEFEKANSSRGLHLTFQAVIFTPCQPILTFLFSKELTKN